ncbi:molybdenum cofactor guanylyltransferase MobA [Agrobacterium vitis]|uniref:Molybdenum cofactor guanylyltransferase n=1 Tax=Agrobacterium vitis TaxID=373 RepID=A0A368NUS4_AGRVI|nr:molybdenum cofactor guanylyltransferase MobA [Agrobacterium vitis]KAA3516135.1 molybdenum cofactor guanylyltransferase MobA [Agrobacterium vitis]KAA3525759.1 molybdenum cofactor guanylyltransferase MobA [Agrobacterium vitis]MCF1478762.1 molybdenum cofactor guanylyltransferase MobA [Agrobacterium vitis]MUZ95457.1 molybdenum cofactor guanylyltransferase MobA [Agrobacterium vitis]MVA31768.1 molybdenum cofactor guanylyltransferase MobA [Agrobacterium vitis]
MGPTATPIDLPGVILAGGRSRRMGADKATTMLAGRTLLDHVANRLSPQVGNLAVNSNDTTLVTHLPRIGDSITDYAGPLAGIASAMEFARQVSSSSHVLISPTDTPFLPADLAQRLLSVTADEKTVVLARSLGRVHPVVGLWPVALKEAIEHWLSAPDNRKLMLFIEDHVRVEVEFQALETTHGPLDPFFNVNSPDDLARAEIHLKALLHDIK